MRGREYRLGVGAWEEIGLKVWERRRKGMGRGRREWKGGGREREWIGEVMEEEGEGDGER